MGHKVSTIDNCHTMNHSRRRRNTLSILAVTLAATSYCDCFTPSPPFASASPHKRTPLAAPGASATIDAPALPSFALPEAPKVPDARSWIRRRFTKRQREEEEEYEQRKHEWAATYTNVHCLRETFGDNKNKLWGDLDASTCRRLYKTLLPRALLELYRLGLNPEDLAPLAYKARVAAKLYARERCIVPARLWAMYFDGMRAWKKYNKFQVAGMSYDQVWDKYEQEIMQEIESAEGLTEEDVTAKICLRILERSCTTNEGVDKLFLREHDAKAMEEQQQDISNITQQLEKDVRAILDPKHKAEPANAMTAQRVKALRMVVRAKRRMEQLKLLEDEKKSKAKETKDGDNDFEEDRIVYPWNARTNKMNDRPKRFENRKFPTRSRRQ
jgi:hypothetical protein